MGDLRNTRDLSPSELTRLTTADGVDDTLGSWDRYEISELIGMGGMGRVYRAWDPRLRRSVAIKILTQVDQRSAARFLREAQAQARVDHPNVCKVHEVGEFQGRPFIVMQLIEGPSLADRSRELSLEHTVIIVRQVAEAVHAAHRLGLVHRDLKPANIMLEERSDGSWQPYVVDFGLVRELSEGGFTATGEVLGTPSFMAPEQVDNARVVDRRVDVYALGATLYDLIAGRPPHAGDSPVEIMVKVLNGEVTPLAKLRPGMSAELETVIMTCLEHEPHRRYPTARALADDLGHYLDGDPITARPASFAYRWSRRVRKHRTLTTVIGGFLLLSLALAGLWLEAAWSAAKSAELAQRFGHQVERIESLLWRDRSLDLHDVRPVEQRSRERLGALAGEVDRHGRRGRGPGRTALGRGYLALHDLERAREQLQLAWNDGYRSPETAYALGLTLGEIYHRELGLARQIGSPGLRAARLEELRGELLEPALECLRASAGAELEVPEYLAAQLAFLEGRHEDALVMARAAFHTAGWLYEAKLLEAEILREQAYVLNKQGDYAAAMLRYAEAALALEPALAIGRSDPRVHAAMCRLHERSHHDQVWSRGQVDATTLSAAVSSCENALRANPEHALVHAVLANIHDDHAHLLMLEGEDPTPALRLASAAASAALRLDPGMVYASETLSASYWLQGQQMMLQGEDPRPWFQRAIDAAEHAVALEPENSDCHNALGLVLLDLGEYLRSEDTDPRAVLQRAVASFQRSWEIDSSDSADAVNVGMSYSLWLQYEVDHGLGDPASTAQRGLAILADALAVNPQSPWAHRTVGFIHLQMGRWLRRRGQPAEAKLEQAVASLDTCLALRPTDGNVRTYLVAALIELADDPARDDQKRTADLARAHHELETGLDLNPNDLQLAKLRAELQNRPRDWRDRPASPASHG